MLIFLRRYGVSGFIRLVLAKIYTLFFFPNSRLIRIPFDIRNRSNIDLGKNLTCGSFCRIEAHPNRQTRKEKLLIFGDNVQLNDFVHIVAVQRVSIGNNVLMASKIFISDSNHGDYSGDIQSSPEENPIERTLQSDPIVIQDNVWLGEFVTVLKGVTIGKGSIIGSMSVVSKDIPPYSIAVGSPAKVIKKYNFSSKKWERV